MMRLIPDRIFDKISDITIEFIREEGIRGLVLDIDNTMAPQEIPLPDDMLLNWIGVMKNEGIKLFVLSNNRENRVARFARALDLPYIYRGMKPFPRSFGKAVRSMGLPKNEVAAVGDQIFTDVMGAHIIGIRAWLVNPVSPGKSLFYRVRRHFETPFLNRYYSRGGILTSKHHGEKERPDEPDDQK